MSSSPLAPAAHPPPSPLRNRQFVWLTASNFTFFLALQGQAVVRSWLAFELTHSNFALGKIAAAVGLPMLLMAPLGGVIADRMERRRLIHIGQLVVISGELVILMLLWSGQLQFWHLLCGTFATGLAFPLILPARQALVFNLVGRDSMTHAMAIGGGVFNVSRVLGPLVSGVLIGWIGARNTYTIGVSIYLIAVLCLAQLHPVEAPPRAAPTSVAADLAEGFRYLVSDRLLLSLMVFGLIPMLLAMPTQHLTVVFAQRIWNVGSTGYGVLQAVAGVGGVLGAILVTRMGAAHRLRRMFMASVGLALFLGLFALSPWFLGGVVLALLGHGSASVGNTLNNSAIQMIVPDAVRGRISAFMLMSVSLPMFGTLIVGGLADRFGARMAVCASCAAALVAMLAFGLGSKALRTLDARLQRPVEPPVRPYRADAISFPSEPPP